MKCHIPVDSADAIGDSASAFNALVDTLSQSMHTEIGIRTYTQMLTNHLETDKLCRNALDSLMQMSEAQGGAILTEESGEMKLLASAGIRKPESLLENQLILNVLRKESRNIVEIPQGMLLDGVLADFTPRMTILEPVKYKLIPMGIIVLASGKPFQSEVLDTLDLFSKSLALALHNAITHDQVQKLAAIDPLTARYILPKTLAGTGFRSNLCPGYFSSSCLKYFFNTRPISCMAIWYCENSSETSPVCSGASRSVR